jgi:hypothetical protein
MAQKRNLPQTEYLTLGRQVYLGKCSKRTRLNARAAGLVSITARQMGKQMHSMQAIQRMMAEGRWFDTVKYYD